MTVINASAVHVTSRCQTETLRRVRPGYPGCQILDLLVDGARE